MSSKQAVEWKTNEQEARQKIESDRTPKKDPSSEQNETVKSMQRRSIADTTPSISGAAVWGSLLTQSYRKQGSDVVVYDLDPHTLLFDCSKELDPRASCYVLYKTYPKNADEEKLLKAMGITNMKYKIENGLLSGFAWEKELP